MQMIYNIFIRLYGFCLKIASIFVPKAKFWVDGRKDWQQKMAAKIGANDQVLWIHCSSLGEFEQGKPVIEALKKQYPNKKIALSFFSPSGYEIRKNYAEADYVFYLPLDTKKNAQDLISILKPELLVLVKYEYWYNLIQELHQNKIPTIVVSAIFRENQNFFNNNGNNWFAKKLNLINHFFVQNESSKTLLSSININQVTIAGDTRFDRVKTLINEEFSDVKIMQFTENKKVIIVGSSWPKDEELFFNYLKDKSISTDWKIIFAPHQIDEKSISELEKKFPEAVKYTEYSNDENKQILILDTIGMLSKLYSLADIVYIGGGFGAGIHNTLEAATFGNPIIIGPKYQKFQEAIDQLENGNLISIQNQTEFDHTLNELINNSTKREKMANKAKEYVHQQKNATEVILDYLKQIIK